MGKYQNRTQNNDQDFHNQKVNVKSHFTIGQKQAVDMYLTMKQKDYKNHGNLEVAKLDEDQKVYLKSHHFNLGKLLN